ncbi:hypothetical protein EHS25_007407 [Saitozyma podzolica]|uniref:Xylanolytic transcriptional activator regulatory domain-containing protein n=1 Tax=Saitozyma podzolica TaxID=1890683 RepID=A0A427YPL2_9TREE|nr:hypothetical protein EHS25_007407 [Saitozyma podzolica]
MFSNDMYPSGGDAYPQDPLFALDTLGSVAGAAQVSMQPSVPTSGPVSDPFDSPGKWFESILADAGREETSPTWLTNLLLSATVDEKIGQSSHPNAGLQQFDWGLTDLLDHELFEPIGTHAPGSPAVPEREADLVLAVEAEEMDGQPHAAELPDGLPRESTWPTIYQPRAPDINIVLPAAQHLAAEEAFSLRLPTVSVQPHAREIMTTLTKHAHRGPWPAPELGNFPTTETLTACINLYLSHFAAWLPVIDCPRGSFRVDKAAPLLLKTVAAVGSAYGRGGVEKLGLPLNELVRREIVFICERDSRFIYETTIIQASLLQAMFGLYSGTPKLFQQAEMARTSLVAACKRKHLLRDGFSAAEELRRSSLAPNPLDLDRALKQDDRRRRLGWSIYLACLFNLPSLLPIHDIRAPLLNLSDPGNSPLFSVVFDQLLSEGQLHPGVGDFGFSILAYSLYRLCQDAAGMQQLLRPSTQQPRYGLEFSPRMKHPQALLDQLARLTLNGALSPTHLLLSCPSMAYYSHINFTRLGFMEDVRNAAGRGGTTSSMQAARASLAISLSSDPDATRNIVAHAALLYCLISRFKFDTPPEVIWMFDVALSLWACLRFGNVLPSASAAIPVVVSWVKTPELETWVKTGGPIIIQGLGGITTASWSQLLQRCAEHLQVSSWELGARYRKVLLDLVAEP